MGDWFFQNNGSNNQDWNNFNNQWLQPLNQNIQNLDENWFPINYEQNNQNFQNQNINQNLEQNQVFQNINQNWDWNLVNFQQNTQNQEPNLKPFTAPTPPSKNSNSLIDYPENWENYDLKWKILSLMVENNSSDAYPVVWYEVWLKSSWKILWIEKIWILSKEKVLDFLDWIFTEKQKKSFKEDLEIDLSYEWIANNWEHYRFRINAFHQSKQPSATIRYLRNDIKTLDDLGLPPIVKELSERTSWIVLVCGVTGSWKSTTVAAMVNNINNNFSKHIISIEDPIEYTFEKGKSWIEQREVWTDTTSFSRAMKSALRQNPNILFLWEMRDLESIASAITIAESGHLVLSTIHARNSVQCINKIIDSFPAAQQNQVRTQLAESLWWIIIQKLIPKKSWKWLELAMEVLINNTSVSNLIRENKVHQIESVIQTSQSEWMFLFDENIIQLASNWLIKMEDAITYSNDPEKMKKDLKRLWYIY